MTTTQNYGLKKPAANEYYSINIFNENADAIDAAMKEVDEKAGKASDLAENAGKPNGLATLDGNGKPAQMPNAADIPMEGYGSAAEAINKALDTADAAATAATYTATLAAAGWSDTAPYTQTVTVEGIKADDSPVVDIVLSTDTDTAASELEAWGYISKIETAANSITVTCLEDVPTVDLNIQLKVVR